MLAALAILCGGLARDTPNLIRNEPLQHSLGEPKFDQMTGLDTQRSAAQSAGAMVGLAWLQIVLTTLGTGGLFVTIFYTRRSLAQTVRALDHAQEVSIRQLRAYVEVKFSHAETRRNGVKVLIFSIRNYGDTPATQLRISRNIKYLHGHPWDYMFDEGMILEGSPLRDLHPGGTNEAIVPLGYDAPDMDAEMARDEGSLVPWIHLEYLDAFARHQTVDYSCFITGPGYSLSHVNPAHCFST